MLIKNIARWIKFHSGNYNDIKANIKTLRMQEQIMLNIIKISESRYNLPLLDNVMKFWLVEEMYPDLNFNFYGYLVYIQQKIKKWE